MSPDPNIQLRPERHAPMRELPLWTVMFLAGLVLFVGLDDDSARSRDERLDPGTQSPVGPSLPSPVAAAEKVPRGPDLVEVTGAPGRDSIIQQQAGERPGSFDGDPASGEAASGASDIRSRGDRGGVHQLRVSFSGAGGGPQAPAEEGSFANGIRHGDWMVRWPNGEIHSQGRYENGLLDGPWLSYSAAGQLIEDVSYSRGALEGDWRFYSLQGKVIGEGQHEDNHRSGTWTLRYSDGRIKERGTYVDGLREGVWEFYDDLGLPTTRSGEYRAGVKID